MLVVTVFVPPLMRPHTNGASRVDGEGGTLREVMDSLAGPYPGLHEALLENGDMRPGIALAVNGVTVEEGLLSPVPAGAEVHILPAIGGGA